MDLRSSLSRIGGVNQEERVLESDFSITYPRAMLIAPLNFRLLVSNLQKPQLLVGNPSINGCGNEGSKSTPPSKPSSPLYRCLCGLSLGIIGPYFGYEVFVNGRADDRIILGICLVM